MNGEQLDALILAYLMRGLDAYATEHGIPRIGDEDFGVDGFNCGEYEAYLRLNEDVREVVLNFDLPLSAFLYEFVEMELPPMVYNAPATWKNTADDLLRSFSLRWQASFTLD